jgi:sulfonate transport system permease protein
VAATREITEVEELAVSSAAQPTAATPAVRDVVIESLLVSRTPSRWRLRDRKGLRLLSPVLVVAIWQAASSTGILSEQTLTSPWQIAKTTWDMTSTGELPHDLAASLLRVVIGLSIGIAVGLTAGSVAGLSRLGEGLVDPLMQMVRGVPILALVPLFVIWFGIYEEPKLLIISLGAAVHIYINVYGGIRNVDARLVEAGTVLGLGRRQMLIHVIIPGALPQALIGLRMAIGTSWLLLVVAEQINATHGLGHLLDYGTQFLRTDVIVMVLAIYAVLGLLSDLLVRYLERKALSWRQAFVGT